jgi:hypothetical protein
MTDTTTIPLNKLLAWQGNVRKTDPGKGIDELAASITAHGLLQSLVVRKDKRGKYAVVAGQRRLLALKALAETETIKADMNIPCRLLSDEADAAEISLAENAGMAPHDARRTCAKLCRAAGGELEQIQMLLGHASVQTTERYLGTKQDLVHAPNDAIKLRVAV